MSRMSLSILGVLASWGAVLGLFGALLGAEMAHGQSPSTKKPGAKPPGINPSLQPPRVIGAPAPIKTHAAPKVVAGQKPAAAKPPSAGDILRALFPPETNENRAAPRGAGNSSAGRAANLPPQRLPAGEADLPVVPVVPSRGQVASLSRAEQKQVLAQGVAVLSRELAANDNTEQWLAYLKVARLHKMAPPPESDSDKVLQLLSPDEGKVLQLVPNDSEKVLQLVSDDSGQVLELVPDDSGRVLELVPSDGGKVLELVPDDNEERKEFRQIAQVFGELALNADYALISERWGFQTTHVALQELGLSPADKARRHVALAAALLEQDLVAAGVSENWFCHLGVDRLRRLAARSAPASPDESQKLADSLRRFNQAASDPQYAALTGGKSFALTRALLSRYLARVDSEPAIRGPSQVSLNPQPEPPGASGQPPPELPEPVAKPK